MTPHEDFENHGFLGAAVADSIPELRAENTDWFGIVEDTSAALMRAATSAMDSVKTTSLAPKAVAVRVLLRSCGTLQAIILLTERGMVAEGRTLARSLVENAFCIAALNTAPDEFLGMLKQDFEGSNLKKARFIIASKLFNSGAQQQRLQSLVNAIGKAQTMSPKKVAKLGPLTKQYLAYQMLSDDSAHPSARSLHRHVQTFKDESGWRYKWGPGTEAENAATLYHTALAALPIGVGVTELLKDAEGNKAFGELAERFHAMPPIFELL